MNNLRKPKTRPNNPERKGERASSVVTFGDLSRYAVFAVHTRFEAVTWFVTDAEAEDEETGAPKVIRQGDTFEAVVADWAGKPAFSHFRKP